MSGLGTDLVRTWYGLGTAKRGGAYEIKMKCKLLVYITK